jgi:hypothetical protein
MELQSKFLESLDQEDDLGMVIRTHIIIEQYLNVIIEAHLVDVDSFKKAKLTYEQTYLLALSMGLKPRFKGILKTIGSIRNDFAHKLRSDISKQDANALYQNLDEQEKVSMQRNYKNIENEIGEKVEPFSQITARQKFMYCVIVATAALQAACNQLPKKAIK